MSSPDDRPGDAPDVRGRTVVWRVGSPAPVRRRRVHPALRWVGLTVLVSLAAFVLAYAVHAYVAVAPLPAGPDAPLWLPQQLPADEAVGPGEPVPPTSSATAGSERTTHRAVPDRGASIPVAPSNARAERPTERVRAKASGFRTGRSSSGSHRGSDDSHPGSSSGSTGSSHGASDDASSGSGGHTSGGSSGTDGGGGHSGSGDDGHGSAGSGSTGGGPDHEGGSGHGSSGGSGHDGSHGGGHDGSDDGGSNGSGRGSRS